MPKIIKSVNLGPLEINISIFHGCPCKKGFVVLFFTQKSTLGLKVRKIENFFDSDFGICVISLLVMSKY